MRDGLKALQNGHTRLENTSDLETILSLPAALQGAYLYLLARRNLNSPGALWSDVASACCLSRPSAFRVLKDLKARGLASQIRDFWNLKSETESLKSETLENDQSLKSETLKSQKRDSKVSDLRLSHTENTVLDSENDMPKEVEVKLNLRTSTTAVVADQILSNPQPPTPPARVSSPVAPGRLASFGPRTPNPKPVPSQAQAGNRPTGCESLPAAREENYKLLAAYFDRPNMSRYPDVLEEWQASAASWTQFPTPYLEIVLNTARGLRPGVTESGPGFAVLALSNPSSLKIPDDIRAVLVQSRPSSASPALRNSAAPREPGVWIRGDGTPITVHEWYEDGACLTDRGDFPTALTRAWKPLLPLEMEAV